MIGRFADGVLPCDLLIWKTKWQGEARCEKIKGHGGFCYTPKLLPTRKEIQSVTDDVTE